MYTNSNKSKEKRNGMPLTYHPKTGQIVMCDFSKGFTSPEMVKKRPVIILSPEITGRPGLVTVVPLSTKLPNPVKNYHLKLPNNVLPQLPYFQGKESWLKGDMLYTVSLKRLDLIRLRARDPETGKRQYFKKRLNNDYMRRIRRCVLAGLGLSSLGEYL